MPYARKNKMRSKYSRKNKGFSKKQVQQIKRISLSTGELKTFTPSVQQDTSIVSGNTNAFTFSVGMAQGDGEGERVGDQVRVKDYHMNMNIQSGTAKGLIRVIVFEKLNDQTTLNSMTEVYSLYPTIQTATGRYKIHMDKTYSINSSNVSNLLIKKTFRPVIRKLDYVAGTTTLTNTRGQLSGLILTDNSTATQIVSNTQTRVRYYDN